MSTLAPLTAEHWPDVARIYAAGIATGHATFEAEVPAWDAFDSSHLPDHRFVTLQEGAVAGWVAASPTSSRPVYAGVVEHSVYVDPAYAGRGLGAALLNGLIESTEFAGIWTVKTAIFPENDVSLRLHERVGFRRVGVHERMGLMRSGPLAGQWRDVVLMERRSRRVGTRP